MFSKVSQFPLFAEFKKDYEDQEKTRSFYQSTKDI